MMHIHQSQLANIEREPDEVVESAAQLHNELAGLSAIYFDPKAARICICCSEPFYSAGTHNVGCSKLPRQRTRVLRWTRLHTNCFSSAPLTCAPGLQCCRGQHARLGRYWSRPAGTANFSACDFHPAAAVCPS